MMMSILPVLIVACAVVLALLLLWAYSIAHRLDRLHIRVDQAAIKLEAALNRRAAVIALVVPDLAEAAGKVEAVGLTTVTVPARRDVEDALMRALCDTITHPLNATEGDSVADVVADSGQDRMSDNPVLVDANERVELAVRFYNQAVADTRALSDRPIVRALHLAGSAPEPQRFEPIHLC